MKASELIKRLEWLIENHGDETVVVYEMRYGDLDMYPVIGASRVKDELTYVIDSHVILLGGGDRG